MKSDHVFSFMTEPPSLNDVWESGEYMAVRDAAQILYNRMKSRTETGGILTASRTLVETTCKTLLDCLNIEYDNKIDLPDLGKEVLIALDLHPGTKTTNDLKRLCQAPINMVNVLASLRNAHGDAHGRNEQDDKLPFYHSELAAYLSCALTKYLIEAYEAKNKRRKRESLSDDEKQKLINIWEDVGKEYNMSNPDNLPYSEALEKIARRFTQETALVLPRRDIYLFLLGRRKNKKTNE